VLSNDRVARADFSIGNLPGHPTRDLHLLTLEFGPSADAAGDPADRVDVQRRGSAGSNIGSYRLRPRATAVSPSRDATATALVAGSVCATTFYDFCYVLPWRQWAYRRWEHPRARRPPCLAHQASRRRWPCPGSPTAR
jgi:hypothetical protein